MTAGPGALGLLWLWTAVAALGPGEPEHPAQAPAEAFGMLTCDHDFGCQGGAVKR